MGLRWGSVRVILRQCLSVPSPSCRRSSEKGSCLLGLDPGSVVIGVAVSDPGLTVASPLVGLQRKKKFSEDAAALARIIRDRNIGGMIVGLPKNMDGSEGPAAQSARALVRNLVEKRPFAQPRYAHRFLGRTHVERRRRTFPYCR